jgi:transcriptional regulator with PAS, ATPase and Fis domain
VGVLERTEAPPLVLEIMLNEAAIALANADLFTAIRAGHERLAAIMAGIADRMMIVNRERRVVWMNEVAARACGADAGGAGLHCFEAFGQEETACQACPAVRSLASGHVERDVRVERLPNGRLRYLDLVTAPLVDGSGQVGEVLEVAHDVTELVELEERLRESALRLEDSNRSLVAKTGELERSYRALRDAQAQLVAGERLAAVGETIVGLQHAIIGPVTSMVGALRVLKREDLAAATRQAALAQAEEQARKVEQIVRGISGLRHLGGIPHIGDISMPPAPGSADEEQG